MYHRIKENKKKKKKNPILVASNSEGIKQVEESAAKHFPHVVQEKIYI